MIIDLLQYPGVILGLVGAILVSGSSTRSRRWGFGLWIGSNACLITWSLAAGAWGLLAMYVVYSVTSVAGLRNNAESTSSLEQQRSQERGQTDVGPRPSLLGVSD